MSGRREDHQDQRAQPANPIPPTQPANPVPPTQPANPVPPTQQIPQPDPPQHTPHAGPQHYPPTPQADPSKDISVPVKSKLRFGDPLSIVLILIIVVALAFAGLLGGELYARHRGDAVVAAVVECVVQDKVSVSFGPRPLLLQHMTGGYTGINIETAGNQIREAKGMKVDLTIDDVRIQDTGDSVGTVGALDARITWSSDGIRETIQDAIPLLGGTVTEVNTDPAAGTIELVGRLGRVTARPQVVDNGVSLQVLEVSGLGFRLPREIVQPALDVFTSRLTRDYPMGIHADSVQVTDTGVVSHFSTRNAPIPPATEDPCFSGI